MTFMRVTLQPVYLAPIEEALSRSPARAHKRSGSIPASSSGSQTGGALERLRGRPRAPGS